MAETKPTTTPEWNTGGANRATPNGAKIILGWVLNEKPVSSAFKNWIEHWSGAGWKWLYERIDDGIYGGGGDEEDLYIHPPTPSDSVAGGQMSISGADAVTSGVGGALRASGGAGAGAGPGGDADVFGGTGGSSGADGGDSSVRGGPAVGTDTDGGDTTISGGAARGDGASSVFLLAADGSQGAGSTLRTPGVYVELDGPNERIEMKRPTVDEPRVLPTAGVIAGMRYTDSARDSQPMIRASETRWESQVLTPSVARGAEDLGSGGSQNPDGGIVIIPDEGLFAGAVFRFFVALRAINGSVADRDFTATIGVSAAPNPYILKLFSAETVLAGNEALVIGEGYFHVVTAGASGAGIGTGQSEVFNPLTGAPADEWDGAPSSNSRNIYVDSDIDTTGDSGFAVNAFYTGGDEANTGWRVESFHVRRL